MKFWNKDLIIAQRNWVITQKLFL